MRARSFVQRRFPGRTVELLAQEASARTYMRIVGEGAVLMVRPDRFVPECDPCCRATALFQACGVRVPKILETWGRLGLMLLEDCGDDLLSLVLPGLDPGQVSRLWGAALEDLLRLRRGTSRLHPGEPAGRTWLGPGRLAWEMRFFHAHWIVGMRGAPLDPGEVRLLNDFYRLLARRTWEAMPPVLCHRDYHARNLLRAGPADLVTTDHQDARWGPALYDLASLVRDPYVSLPGGLEEEMLEAWCRETGEALSERVRHAWETTALQRNLKAAGTYACQVAVHGREHFRTSLAPTLDWARRALERLPEYRGPLAVLEKYRLLEA